jgi:isochorismate synthase EntC
MRWLEWMEEQDRAAGVGDRNRFGAPFGAVTADGDGICWVAIRGMQWTQHGEAAALRLAAGCGVTGRSELDREWHELGIKLQAIRTALAV